MNFISFITLFGLNLDQLEELGSTQWLISLQVLSRCIAFLEALVGTHKEET